MMYDYLVVGAGFFGAVFAHELIRAGKKVLVVDRRNHIGGNAYTETVEEITVHRYGPHIFHTDDLEIWEYVNAFAPFNRFTNSPVANYKGELFNLPFNMNTFYQMWGVRTPAEARAIIDRQIAESGIEKPHNLEEQAIKLVGQEIYMKLIKGYTEKQWGKSAKELPAFLIKRLPLRFCFDNNYYNDRYQGIPKGGYTQIFEQLLADADVMLNTDFITQRDVLSGKAEKVIYTGMIDEYFEFPLGSLEYRSLRFETKIMEEMNFQGNAVINYTGMDTRYTRVVEHKHFEFGTQEKTVITYEYPQKWAPGCEPYYSINDEQNNALYDQYASLAAGNIINLRKIS
jgi:UDP-galactopyranose mutase